MKNIISSVFIARGSQRSDRKIIVAYKYIGYDVAYIIEMDM